MKYTSKTIKIMFKLAQWMFSDGITHVKVHPVLYYERDAWQ